MWLPQKTTKMNIKESIDLMYKLVQKHLKQIRKLGEKIDYECDLYEQKHLKNSSPSSSSLLNESIHLYNNNNIIIDNDDDMNNDDKHLNFYLNQKCQLIQNEKFGRHFIVKDQILKGEIIIEKTATFIHKISTQFNFDYHRIISVCVMVDYYFIINHHTIIFVVMIIQIIYIYS